MNAARFRCLMDAASRAPPKRLCSRTASRSASYRNWSAPDSSYRQASTLKGPSSGLPKQDSGPCQDQEEERDDAIQASRLAKPKPIDALLTATYTSHQWKRCGDLRSAITRRNCEASPFPSNRLFLAFETTAANPNKTPPVAGRLPQRNSGPAIPRWAVRQTNSQPFLLVPAKSYTTISPAHLLRRDLPSRAPFNLTWCVYYRFIPGVVGGFCGGVRP